MATTNFTLAVVLDLIKAIKKRTETLEDERDQTVDKKKYRGDWLSSMDANRMLYFIGTHEAMVASLDNFAKDFEVKDKTYLANICRVGLEDKLAIKAMKGYLSLSCEIHQNKEEQDALEKYASTFDDADYKRIKKEKSIAQLKKLGLM